LPTLDIMARAVLLDVDGTLVDSNDLHARAWQDALALHGFPVELARLRKLIGMGGDKLLPAVSGLEEGSAQAKPLLEARKRIFTERYLPQVEPFPRHRALLERLVRDGYRLAVASSAGRDELTSLLARGHMAGFMEQTTSSDDAEGSKPEPDILHAALKKLDVSAEDALMLGDTPYDVEAAQRAGVAIVAVRSGGWSEAELAGAIAVYADLADLLARYDDSPFAQRAPAT
jgi:phosphoglycolate phosphatase-like HAD superfamily hydrolase